MNLLIIVLMEGVVDADFLADLQDIRVEIVGFSQLADGDSVAIGDAAQIVSLADLVGGGRGGRLLGGSRQQAY